MQAARQELHSTNQELAITNQELKDRNAALAMTSAELAGVVGSIDLPIVTVDHDLRIRRFTRQAGRWWSLTAGDLGRPVGDLKPRQSMPDLEPLLAETIATLADGGERHRLRIRPFRAEDGRIDGAIVVIWPIGTAG